MKNKHSCIKCSSEYEDNQVDAYYCPSCVKSKAVIAAEIDAKLSKIPRKETLSDLQIYERAQKIRGFPSASIFL